MRLSRTFKWWQLTFFVVALSFPSIASAGWYASAFTRGQPLEPEDFPRSIVWVGDSPLTDTEMESAGLAAVEQWNSVGCSFAELSWDGHVDSMGDADGSTALVFVSPDEEKCFAIPEDIAWTLQAACCSSNGQITDADGCDGTLYPPQTVLLNRDDFEWRATPDAYQTGETTIVDAASVFTHELGHVLDLRHTDADRLATMARRYLRDGGMATLAADDRAALCDRWPGGSDECEDDADCPTFGECVATDLHQVCQEERAETGDYCDLGLLTCPGECLVTSPAAYTGYCSVECLSDDACPDDMLCAQGFCELAEVPRAQSCSSVARGSGDGLVMLWLFGLFVSSRRRRRRAVSRSR